MLDGNELRGALSVVGNYSREQLVELAKNYFELAKLLYDPDLVFANDQNLVAEDIALRISEVVVAKH